MSKFLLIFSWILFIFLIIAEAEEKEINEGELEVTEINWRKITDFEKLAEYANSEDLGFQLAAVRQVRRLISCETAPPYDDVIRSGILPSLVEFLGSKNTTLQYDSVLILASIASGTSAQTNAIVDEANAIPSLINLLKSPNNVIQSQSLLALGNIIEDSPINRDKCMIAGILPPLSKLADSANPKLKHSDIFVLRNIAWTLKNLCRHSAPNLVEMEVILDIIPVFSKFIENEDPQTVSETLSGIGLCGNGSQTRIQAILNNESMIKKVFTFLPNRSQSRLQHLAFKVVDLIAGHGNSNQIQTLLDYGIMDSIEHLIKSPNKHIKQPLLSFWANFMKNANEKQMAQILKAKLFPEFLRYIERRDLEIRMEAARLIENASKNSKIAEALIPMKAISKLLKVLKKADESEELLIISCLSALKNFIENTENGIQSITEEADYNSALSRFESFDNDEIQKLSKKILKSL